jgi:Na+/H+ antiporter NhaD/arsenite permease-like protein
MAVAVLAEAPLTTDAQGHQLSALASMGNWLDNTFGNAYIITGIIGCLSSVIDNVPLVASCMGMYDIAPAGTTGEMAQFVADGTFWQMLAFCAGVGGSMLIIGSAAGVVVMGLEKISFGWYMKHFSWLAFAGYIAGMGVYWVEKLFI